MWNLPVDLSLYTFILVAQRFRLNMSSDLRDSLVQNASNPFVTLELSDVDGYQETFSLKFLKDSVHRSMISRSAPYLGLVNVLELLPPAFLNRFNGTSHPSFSNLGIRFRFRSIRTQISSNASRRKRKNPMRLMSTIWHPLST
ncbi:hypothetical protein TNCT_49201 [Trichonephila clavata]|uniref:Uncharacterized protein n=1 Tax=Trichonephila clavata TaxID=2740835 RepID=A0A8X6EWQ7_TRICU|nr:hypothetical protein TNCT_49201 [Trichonephila clavata]